MTRRVILIMALVATLSGFAAVASGAVVLRNTETATNLFLLEAYNGSAWADIDASEYQVYPNSGQVVKRSGNWETYTAYRWTGTIVVSDLFAYEVNQEPVTFAETALDAPIGKDGAINTDSAYNLIASDVVAGDAFRVNENGLQSGDVSINGDLRLGGGVQTKKPRTVEADTSFGDVAWTTPEYARAKDGTYASTTVFTPSGENSNYLIFSDFGFRIPRTAQITGIVFDVYSYADSGSGHYFTVQTTFGGTEQTSSFDGTPDTKTLGSATDDWGAGLSPSQVNSSDFGFVLWVTSDISTVTAYIDYVRATVYYTTAMGETVGYLHGNHLDSVGVVNMDAVSATPGNPSSSSDANLYVKGGKIIVQYNDGGTVRYKYLDLTGTGVTWTHSTSAP